MTHIDGIKEKISNIACIDDFKIDLKSETQIKKHKEYNQAYNFSYSETNKAYIKLQKEMDLKFCSNKLILFSSIFVSTNSIRFRQKVDVLERESVVNKKPSLGEILLTNIVTKFVSEKLNKRKLAHFSNWTNYHLNKFQMSTNVLTTVIRNFDRNGTLNVLSVVDKSRIQVINILEHLICYLLPIKIRDDIPNVTEDQSFKDIIQILIIKFDSFSKSTFNFISKLPGFRKLSNSFLMNIVEHCFYPIMIIMLSIDYNLETKEINWFNLSYEEFEIITNKNEILNNLTSTFHIMGKDVQELKLNHIEIAFICAIILYDRGNMYEYKEFFIESLEFYIKSEKGHVSQRHLQILHCFKNASIITKIYTECISKLLIDSTFLDSAIPPLK